MNIEGEFKTMKELVLDVLRKSERSRNDDSWLILCVMQRLGEDLKCVRREDGSIRIDWFNINSERLSCFETIRRVRQEIQNVHKMFLPTDPSILIKRRIRQEGIRSYYRKRYMDEDVSL